MARPVSVMLTLESGIRARRSARTPLAEDGFFHETAGLNPTASVVGHTPGNGARYQGKMPCLPR